MESEWMVVGNGLNGKFSASGWALRMRSSIEASLKKAAARDGISTKVSLAPAFAGTFTTFLKP